MIRRHYPSRHFYLHQNGQFRRQRQLSAKLLAAQETERKRISTELRDELGPALILMKLRLARIEEELRADQSSAREQATDLAQFIDQIIEEVRRLSGDLCPAVLEDLGLSAALRCLVDTSSRPDPTAVESSILDIDHLLSPGAQVVVYRIIQEAFTNARRHAQARRVSLRVERQRDRLAMVVETTGSGSI